MLINLFKVKHWIDFCDGKCKPLEKRLEHIHETHKKSVITICFTRRKKKKIAEPLFSTKHDP